MYNRISCSACHLKNARGKPPDGPADEAGGLLIRLSLSGRAEHGGPRPHPAYGDQLQNHAVPGVPEEGRIAIEYREFPVTLADGEVVWLRQPKILLHDLHYGPLGEDVLLSARVGPALVGLGLLEAVSEPTLLALERRPKRDGIRGHVNWVWDAVARRTAIGRFGHKANVPNLPQQVASAFLGDLGITSELFPEGPCTAVQQACRWAAASGRHPELDRAQFQSIVLYVRSLAVPARRHGDDPEVVRGEAIFRAIGCNECHLDTLTTGPSAPLPELSNQTIHPYTDLLVHDLGPGLADGRPDFLAGPGEWRTAPLWEPGPCGSHRRTYYLASRRPRPHRSGSPVMARWRSGDRPGPGDWARTGRSARVAPLSRRAVAGVGARRPTVVPLGTRVRADGTEATRRAYQVSPNGRTSTSNDQAERSWVVNWYTVSATAAGWTKNASPLSGRRARAAGRSTIPSMMTRAT